MGTEPDWKSVRERMMALTLRELQPVKWYFSGCLGGASSKADTVDAMVRQMQHWWHHAAEFGPGPTRVKNIIGELEACEFLRSEKEGRSG